jgi:hypothetical protein
MNDVRQVCPDRLGQKVKINLMRNALFKPMHAPLPAIMNVFSKKKQGDDFLSMPSVP